MKKAMILLFACVITISSFGNVNPFHPESAVSMSSTFVTALRHESSIEFLEVFPTLPDLEQIIKKNKCSYGSFSKNALEEFRNDYENRLLPEAVSSFNKLLIEGKEKGIDWSKVEFVSTEFTQVLRSVQTIPAIITIQCEGKEYRIRIEKALIIDDSCKASHFFSFV